MLQKALNIGIAVILTIATTGFTISKHYCGKNLVSVSVNSEAKACCSNENGMCCHHESEHIGLDNDLLFTAFNFLFEKVVEFDIPYLFTDQSFFHYQKNHFFINFLFTNSSPPLNNKAQISLLQAYLL